MALDSSDLEELYARRIADRVTESVDRSIRRRYAWVTGAFAAAAVVATWLGGSALLVSVVDSQVRDTVQTAVREAVEKKLERIETAAEQVRIDQVKAEDRLSRLRDTLEQAEARTDEARRHQTELEDRATELTEFLSHAQSQMSELRGDVEKIETNVRSVGTDYAAKLTAVEGAIDAVAELSRSVENLQRLVLENSSITDSEPASLPMEQGVAATVPDDAYARVRNDVTSIKNVSSTLTHATEALKRPTVYLQVGGDVDREQVEKIRTELARAGFSIPGIEQVPSSHVNQVRWFHENDETAAKQLGRDASGVLRSQGYGVTVTAEDYTDWPKLKPPPGTIELWLHLPKLES